jgi:hypothetical protein
VIETNFSAFRRRFSELILNDGIEVDHDQGSDKVAKGTPPPRVLFVLLPNEKIENGMRGFGAVGTFGKPMPPPMAIRVVSFDVHIWGRDRDEAELLIGRVANAVQDVASGSVQFRGGTWFGEDGMVNDLGSYYVLHVEMWIPITRTEQSVKVGISFDVRASDPMGGS